MFAKAMLTGTAQAGEYLVNNSLRFNDDDTAYMEQTFSAGNRQTFTWAGWLKRGTLGTSQFIFGANSGVNVDGGIFFSANNEIGFSVLGNVYNKYAPAALRDPSAWYHVVIAFDSTEAQAVDRIKIYVNGQFQTDYFTQNSGLPPLNMYTNYLNNATNHTIGKLSGYAQNYFDGYMADVHFIDGQALDASYFGQEDADGFWKPKKYSGTYGTNGFYLDFADNKWDGTNATAHQALGKDVSGNGNNWTVTNIQSYRAGVDSWVDNSTVSGTTYSDRTLDKLFNGIAQDNNDNFAPFNCFEFNANPGSVTFSPAIQATSSIKMWVASYLGGDKTVKINGTNFTFTSTPAQNVTAVLYTLPVTTLTSIEVDTQAANDTRFYAIVVDDVLLVDRDAAVVPNEDSVDDTPSVNYATWNPLVVGNRTFANGNLDITMSASTPSKIVSTIGASSGKYYMEYIHQGNSNWPIGISADNRQRDYLGASDGNTSVSFWCGSVGTQVYINSSSQSFSGSGTTWAASDIVGVALDADNEEVSLYKNGVLVGAAVSYAAYNWDQAFFAAGNYINGNQYISNFGQRPFAYTPPAGFKALNSKNLPKPTITDGSQHFKTLLYTGNGGTQSVQGLEFQPDFVWIKNRDGANSNQLTDAVRGPTKYLFSDTTLAEETRTNQVTSFDSTGITVDSNAAVNGSGNRYVAWNWNAGGSTVTNTDGTITSQVRANTTAGFSIVSYTGNGTAGATVGHGLTQTPEMVIVKRRNNTGGFLVYNKQTLATKYLALNLDYAETTLSTVWNNTEPTSSVFSIGTDAGVNGNTDTFISYCFHSVDGFSKFGSYTGNGSTDGPFIYTGFRPAWVLIKRTDSTGDWNLQDSTRTPYNWSCHALFPNFSNAENTSELESTYGRDYLSNGFKIRASHVTHNISGGTYIYMAFAENPFKKARAR